MTADNMISCLRDYMADPAFDGHFNLLFILKDCAFPDQSFQDTQRLTYLMEPFYAQRDQHSRTAIYAPDDLSFGMGRMYHSLADRKTDYEIAVFRELPEAFSFLNLSVDAQARIVGNYRIAL